MGRRCDRPPDNLIDFYGARELVGFDRFLHVQAWLNRGFARPAVQRGVAVLSDNQRKGAMTDAERDVMFGKTQFDVR